jgi:hypothetical protein
VKLPEGGTVPDSGVISDVSNTLVTFINAAAPLANLTGQAELNDLSDLTKTASSLPTLSIFLFEVMEDSSARNEPRVRRTQKNPVVIQKPPMALQLNYLFTPWTGVADTDQKWLGFLLRLFYEQAILSGPVLQGGLQGSSSSLKVTLHTLTLEERTRIWLALTRPYRTSLSYGVRVVNIDVKQSQTVASVSNGQLASSLLTGGTS